ncbi:MAG: outer membrane protein assembly factor BamD [Bacteroidia bacterium]|nr:MAG: outer membrane protein assembly factor BamD [Bacteroidia bacterium]
MRSKLYILSLLALIVTSCGEYEKLLKSTDFELKKQKVYDYYDEGKYVKTVELLGQILPRFRATEEAEQLNWINAQAHYKLQDWLMAGTYYQNFADLYPMSTNAEEAAYMSALCDYNMSPRPELDQAYTRKAIESFTIFLKRYPMSSRSDDSKAKVNELQEKLVEKLYLSAKLYYDLKQYRAATVSLSNSLKEYPDTKYREELMFLKLDALYLYATLSVAAKQVERYQATLDEYYSFIEEFPEGRYSKDVRRIMQATARFLKVDTTGTTAETN